ncbi:hypothetical protein LHYA1_G007432 [Lachnellula hyalina]|uniref:WW domain-containing protein n=1 Tax=Lachnellula hyalina TaxID=1316788 RepID=A0A8H8TWY3_9HELO|nr:uncharacterized protein LHYA1_G007432 [Lachnellula hyalina]TVY23755.1 hypothetical protein LHYA1_G007432 [Lachnellula hyalina]
MAANSSYNLGLLNGNLWRQWSDPSGLIYYQNVNTQVTSYQLPAGWEDHANDVWALDPTKAWPQWNNQRTRRARLDDPNPPPPATYLDDPHVTARVSVLERTPQSPELLYRRVMCGILQWVFRSNEGFSVLQEGMAADLHPDFTVFKVLRRPGGSLYEYDFLVGETKVPGEAWGAFTDHLHTVCANNNNDSKNVYGLLQIGFEIQLYKHENQRFEAISERMHLVRDVQSVIAWFQHVKARPMPFL